MLYMLQDTAAEAVSHARRGPAKNPGPSWIPSCEGKAGPNPETWSRQQGTTQATPEATEDEVLLETGWLVEGSRGLKRIS